jgi:hypothetical protein
VTVAPATRTPAHLTFSGEPPRELTWPQFEAERRRSVTQGMHQLFNGPTQSGKTVLCRINVRDRDFVVVWGTKARDASLQAYVDEGYVRINHWFKDKPLGGMSDRTTQLVPDRKGKLIEKPYKIEKDALGKVRLILWPEIKSRPDLRRHRDEYAKCLDDVFIVGGWTVVIDEMLWATRRSGLNLDSNLAEVAFGAASNKVSLYFCMQRPTGMERVTWSSVADAYLFKCGVVDDIRELAALGTVDPRDAVIAIRTKISGHKFLHLPTRGQSQGWAISEVDPRVI